MSMKSSFKNYCILSGYVNSEVFEHNKGNVNKYGISFYIRVPRQEKSTKNYFSVAITCWNSNAEYIKEIVDKMFGEKITVVVEMDTFVSRTGSPYYTFRLREFCKGWYDLSEYRGLGEIYKNKMNRNVVDKIAQDWGF